MQPMSPRSSRCFLKPVKPTSRNSAARPECIPTWHLEEPIKRFQRGHGLKVDALVKPGGPTIRKLGEVAQRGGSPSPTVAKAKDGQVAQAGPQRIFTPTRKPAPPDERAPRKQTKRVPLPGEIYLGTFKDAIAERESKSYQDVNRDLNTGKEALGRYQMTEGALQDLGLMDAGNNWLRSAKYGIGSRKEFLNNPLIQERVMEDFLEIKENRLRNNGSLAHSGQQIEGKKATFTITEGALLAAAHRQGASGVRQYLDWMRAIVRYQETSPTGRHDSDAFGIPMRERSMTLAQAKRWFRNEKLLVGYVDINGDGQDEMFAYIRGLGFCGSAGCNTIAFGKRGGKWVAFAELYSHIGQRGVSLHLTDKRSTAIGHFMPDTRPGNGRAIVTIPSTSRTVSTVKFGVRGLLGLAAASD